jgi:divalent metal cation (Fe/Co/Zn/Cd) transporter
LISLTGTEILIESVQQLTDTSDKTLVVKIGKVTEEVPGVLGVANIRAR